MKLSRRAVYLAIISLIVLGAGIFLGIYFFLPKTRELPKLPILLKKTIEVKDWKTFSTKDFSFQYPADWTITTDQLKAGDTQIKTTLITSLSPEKTASGAATPVFDFRQDGGQIMIQNGSFSLSGKAQDYKSIVEKKFTTEQFSEPKAQKIGNRELSTYTPKQNGAWTTYLVFPYDGGAKNYYEISFGYNNSSHPENDYESLFKKVIGSFIFTNAK